MSKDEQEWKTRLDRINVKLKKAPTSVEQNFKNVRNMYKN